MIRILHVEDNPDDAELMHLNMMRLSRDIAFEWVESGVKAVQALSNPNRYDCVISDFQMPQMNGLDLLRAVREENNYLPFIFLTGQGNEEIAAQALREGADDYFTKDIGFASYQRLLNSILRNVVAYSERREKENAEKALRESEERFRLLAENSTDMISRHAPDATFLYVSPACRFILGYEPDELIGKNTYDLLEEGFQPSVRQSHSEIMDFPNVSTATYRMRRKDGSSVWLETTSKTIRDPNTGQVLEIHAATRDISERKRAENSLTESQHRLNTVLHRMPLILFSIDREGIFTLSDGAGLARLGLKPGEVVGQSIYDVYKHYPQILKAYEQARDGKTVSENLDMGTIAFDITYVPLTGPGGERQGVIGVASDITARYFAEMELLQNRALLQRITDTAPALIYILSLENNAVTFVNRRTAEILGYEEAEIYDFGVDILSALIHPDDFARINELNRKMRGNGGESGIENEYRIRRKDGSWCWVHDHCVVFQRDTRGHPSHLLGIATDVTEDKLILEQLRDQTAAFKILFDTAPFAISISRIGPPLRIVEVNRYYSELIGHTAADLDGMDLMDLFVNREDDARFREKFARDGCLHNEYAKIRHKSGRVIECRFSTYPFQYHHEPHILTSLVVLSSES